MGKISRQLGFVLSFCLDELVQLLGQSLYGALGKTTPTGQTGSVLFELICPCDRDPSPVKEFNGLLIILLQSQGPKPLLFEISLSAVSDFPMKHIP